MTEGPIVAEDHYHVPPLDRLDIDELLLLVERNKYFVLHAPRQTGKTSAPERTSHIGASLRHTSE